MTDAEIEESKRLLQSLKELRTLTEETRHLVLELGEYVPTIRVLVETAREAKMQLIPA